MNLNDLKPGVYVLTRDVENPKPDRRIPDGKYEQGWTKWKTIPKGMRFIVSDRYSRMGVRDLSPEAQARIAERPFFERAHIENYRGQFRNGINDGWRENQGDNYRGPDFFLRMVEALQPAEKKLDVFFTDLGLEWGEDSRSVIESMVRHGLLSWDQLRAGIQKAQEDNETENALPGDERMPLPVFTGKETPQTPQEGKIARVARRYVKAVEDLKEVVPTPDAWEALQQEAKAAYVELRELV
jgi:hypothetical protein